MAKNSDWIPTSAAAQALGMSVKQLWKLRDGKVLQQGVHWRNIAAPGAARPTYRWNLKRVESVLNTPAEKRG